MVPVRSGDVSSLASDCLTPAGGLVIKRAGYDVHKNQNAVRVIPLSLQEAQIVRAKIETLNSHFGDRPLLLRGHGSVVDGLRDHRLAAEWGAALKLAVADASARPHSIRATTLQEIAWPDWLAGDFEAYLELHRHTHSMPAVGRTAGLVRSSPSCR